MYEFIKKEYHLIRGRHDQLAKIQITGRFAVISALVTVLC